MKRKTFLLCLMIIFCLGLAKYSYSQGHGIRAQDLNTRTNMENFYKIITIDPNASPASQIVKNITFENFQNAMSLDISNINMGYLYYINPNETDQGVTGNNTTAKYYIDLIGSNVSKIVFVNTDPNNHTYTFSTAEVCPKNISIEVEPGAIIAGTLTINGPFEAEKIQCFDPNATIIFGETVDEVYPEWWGIDGTADDVQINASIDSLGSNGGKVKLSEFTYSITSEVTIDAQDTTIEGLGPGTILQMDANDCYGINLNNKANITITNLTLDGNEDSLNNGKALIYKYNTLQDIDCRNMLIDKCTFQNYDLYGIYIDRGHSYDTLTISNCVFRDSENISSIAIYLNTDGIEKIVNNTFTEIEYGIDINSDGPSFATIADNIFWSCDNTCINVNSDISTISANTFYGGNNFAIVLSGGTNTVNGNSFYYLTNSNPGIDVACAGNTISNNAFSDCKNTEIYVFQVDDNLITGNTFKPKSVDPTNYNVYLQNSDNTIISNNRFGCDEYDVYVDINSNNTIIVNNKHDNLPNILAGTGNIHSYGLPNFHGNQTDTGNLKMYTYQDDSLTDDGAELLPVATSGICFASIIDPNNTFTEEAGMWVVSTNGDVTKISGSANTAATDSDGDLCVFDAGIQASVKNRMGNIGEIRIIYFYN